MGCTASCTGGGGGGQRQTGMLVVSEELEVWHWYRYGSDQELVVSLFMDTTKWTLRLEVHIHSCIYMVIR